jgi:LacI family transcriptional regulator, repressor for deo operon, udp, cdd, tsx, nupC, and nupG
MEPTVDPGQAAPGERPVTATPGSATMADVAKLARVSPATVSRALRGHPSVTEDTRRRVLDAAERLHYAVSPAASRLATGRTGTIAVLVPRLPQWFYATVVAGAGPSIHDAGLDLLLYELSDAAVRRRFFARMPLRRRVDGVIALGMYMDEVETEALHRLHVPVATVGEREVAGWWNVRIDDVDGAAKAVRHLVRLGHQRIGMISSFSPEGYAFRTPIDRRAGYRQVLTAAGVRYAPELEFSAPFGMEGGGTAMAELLSGPEQPTAVFCESDEVAFGALRTLRRAGLRVPLDVSVIGFDDHDMADLLDLSTIAQPVREQGRTAAEMLLRSLTTPDAKPEHVVLPTRLVVRATTGRHATG